jgi:hypothetical protein
MSSAFLPVLRTVSSTASGVTSPRTTTDCFSRLTSYDLTPAQRISGFSGPNKWTGASRACERLRRAAACWEPCAALLVVPLHRRL